MVASDEVGYGAERRHSEAAQPQLVSNPEDRARLEAKNAIRQFKFGIEVVRTHVGDDARPFKLRTSLIQGLHREALQGLDSFAGNWRPGGVSITKSGHVPPDAHLVMGHIEELCDYVNNHWQTQTAIHLSAYTMWHLNWIHPFTDGSGRTSRTLSYVVLCCHMGLELPGKPTIPELIEANRNPYFKALEAADAAWKNNTLDVSEMEILLEQLLGEQLYSVVEAARKNSEST